MTTPPFVCEPCGFSAPNRSRFNKHLSTQKHSLLSSQNTVSETPPAAPAPAPEEEEEEEDEDEDEFLCNGCNERVPVCWCFRCNREDICENCDGNGGDYGEHEEWVCDDCLPTCLKCEKTLFSRVDECCGEGRSDLVEEEEEPDETSDVEEEEPDETSDVEEEEPDETSDVEEEEPELPPFSAQFQRDIQLIASMQDLIQKNTQHYKNLQEFLQNAQYHMLFVLPLITALCGFHIGRNW